MKKILIASVLSLGLGSAAVGQSADPFTGSAQTSLGAAGAGIAIGLGALVLIVAAASSDT